MPTNDYIQPFFNIKGEYITNFYRKDDSLIYEVRASCYRTYLSLLRTYYEIHRTTESVRSIWVVSMVYIFVLNTSNVDILALNAPIRFQKKIPLFSVINN